MIDVAVDAAKQAGALAYQYFKKQLKVLYKPDNSPVTRADYEAEQLIRKIISKKFPDHGIIGEELGTVNPNAKYQWVIDPIDGTRYFAHHFPFWGTLLAILENGKPIIGIAFLPAFGEFYVAQKNKGTYLNNKRIKVSQIADIKSSYIIHGAIHYFEQIGKLKNLVELYKISAGRIGIGNIYSYTLLAKGQVDICIDPNSKVWDVAAPSIIVEEAGGKFTDMLGKFSLTSGSFLAANSFLHNQVIRLLNQ